MHASMTVKEWNSCDKKYKTRVSTAQIWSSVRYQRKVVSVTSVWNWRETNARTVFNGIASDKIR